MTHFLPRYSAAGAAVSVSLSLAHALAPMSLVLLFVWLATV